MLLQFCQQFRIFQFLRLKLLTKSNNFLYSILVFLIRTLDYRIHFWVIFCFGFRKIKIDWAVKIIFKSLFRLEGTSYSFQSFLLFIVNIFLNLLQDSPIQILLSLLKWKELGFLIKRRNLVFQIENGRRNILISATLKKWRLTACIFCSLIYFGFCCRQVI